MCTNFDAISTRFQDECFDRRRVCPDDFPEEGEIATTEPYTLPYYYDGKRSHRPARKKRKIWAINTLDANKRAMYAEAEARRFDSPEDNIAFKCIRIKKNSHKLHAEERFEPALITHVRSLWKAQSGHCSLTDRELVWREEDVKRRGETNVATLVCLQLKEYGDRWVVGNVALVCSGINGYINMLGIDTATRLAERIASFATFKRSNHHLAGHSMYDAWDRECRTTRGDRRWSGFDQRESKRAESVFFAYRMGNSGAKDRRTPPNEMEFARHCTQVLRDQCGRCAVTGVILDIWTDTDPATRLSIDRIDGHLPHRQGNVRITTWHINRAKQDIPDRVFEDHMIAMAAKRKRGERQPDHHSPQSCI